LHCISKKWESNYLMNISHFLYVCIYCIVFYMYDSMIILELNVTYYTIRYFYVRFEFYYIVLLLTINYLPIVYLFQRS